MPFAVRPSFDWQLRSRVLPLGERTRVMGIVNLTPDSFSGDGLRGESLERQVSRALALLDEGADLLDLGAESTRPGSGAASEWAISATEEADRLLPVLQALLQERPDTIISVDTYRAATARAAVAAGAQIINDVSGLLWDAAMAEACAALRCGVVLMHTRGRPDEWRGLPPVPFEEAGSLVLGGLRERMQVAAEAGIEPARTVLDPGYGFGKTGNANYALLARQHELMSLGRPLLAGLSRKSFLGRTLSRTPSRTLEQAFGRGFDGSDLPLAERDRATAAASVAAILNGASLLRVHAVRTAVEAAAIADAVLATQSPVRTAQSPA